MLRLKARVLSIAAVVVSTAPAGAQLINVNGDGDTYVPNLCRESWEYRINGGPEIHLCGPLPGDRAESMLIPLNRTSYLLYTKSATLAPAVATNSWSLIRFIGNDLTLTIDGFIRGNAWGSIEVASSLCSANCASFGITTQNVTYERSFNGMPSIIVKNSAFALGENSGSIAVASVAVREPGVPPCTRQSVSYISDGMVAGKDGVFPILSTTGCLLDGTGVVHLSLATPNAPAVVLVGLTGTGFPLFGGTIWPDIHTVGAIVTTDSVEGFGGFTLPVTLSPTTVGQFTMQALVFDAWAAQGVAISNGYTVTIS